MLTRRYASPTNKTRGGERISFRPRLEALEDRLALAGDPVLSWNDVVLDTIRVDKTAPPKASRALAIIHTAIYDAVNTIERTHQPYAVETVARPNTSVAAAVAGAAHRTLVSLFPAQQATFDAALTAALGAVKDGPAETNGVALGRSVADEILELRANDGSAITVEYTPGGDPGDWRPTPRPNPNAPPAELAGLPAVLPQWPMVTPFCMTSGSQFRPSGIPTLSSSTYAAAFNEVKDLGSATSTTRTADQTAIALFWANGAGTATPPGHLNILAQTVSEGQGLPLADNARLFALLNIAMADAAIMSWDAKYATEFWRPVTAIREADSDGNTDTLQDTSWTPLIVTPPFPTYTSGHSSFSGAATAVLAAFFGTDNISFTLDSEDPNVADRSFTSFSQAADESARSRLYGGIHFNFDNTDGLTSGLALGEFVVADFLQSEPLAAAAELRNGILIVNGTEDNDNFQIARAGLDLVVKSDGARLASFRLSLVSFIAMTTGEGNDRVTIAANVSLPATIYGGDGDDTIRGGSGNDVIFGELGRDSIYGNAGVDLIDGGRGHDFLSGGLGIDQLLGQEGDDTLLGGAGNDLLSGGSGRNRIVQ